MRHLKFDQIYYRLKYKYHYPSLKELSGDPVVKLPNDQWQTALSRDPSYLGKNTFAFFGRTHLLSSREDWENADKEELWNWNLHYFNCLASDYSLTREALYRELIDRWIMDNPDQKSVMGWDPYPTSIRLVNLAKWIFSGAKFHPKWIKSMFMQFRWLSQRLEYDLYGNHLIANAKALCFGGCIYDNEESQEWLHNGIGILESQFREQILDDGGHFELSPSYHNLIIEDLLDLVNLFNAYENRADNKFHEALKKNVKKMLIWAKTMEHPDGEVPFFNDAAISMAPNIRRLSKYSKNLSVMDFLPAPASEVYLPDSGYFRWEKKNAVLIGDVGRIGPDYNPGHAHADTLSFELSIGGNRVIVNSGTSTYDESHERLRQRGTPAHNTVEIDGENSSEVWKSFRVAGRAKPFDFRIKKRGGQWHELECSHDGYKRLKGRNIHCRSWQLEEGRLVVIDKIQGPFMRAVARFYLHPAIKVKGNALILPNGLNIQFSGKGGEFKIVASTWHPEFGKSISSHCIEFRLNTSKASVLFEWK